jgi:hypothetical protein
LHDLAREWAGLGAGALLHGSYTKLTRNGGEKMRKLAVILLIALITLVAGATGMQIAGDTGPDGDGSNPDVIQMAGDTGPDGDG